MSPDSGEISWSEFADVEPTLCFFFTSCAKFTFVCFLLVVWQWAIQRFWFFSFEATCEFITQLCFFLAQAPMVQGPRSVAFDFTLDLAFSAPHSHFLSTSSLRSHPSQRFFIRAIYPSLLIFAPPSSLALRQFEFSMCQCCLSRKHRRAPYESQYSHRLPCRLVVHPWERFSWKELLRRDNERDGRFPLSVLLLVVIFTSFLILVSSRSSPTVHPPPWISTACRQ